MRSELEVMRVEAATLIADVVLSGGKYAKMLLGLYDVPAPSIEERYGQDAARRIHEVQDRADAELDDRIRRSLAKRNGERFLRRQYTQLAMVSPALAKGVMARIDRIKAGMQGDAPKVSGPSPD